MELLTFINTQGQATLTQIQAHMLATYGLKFRTTTEMMMELAKAGLIKEDGHGFWRLTQRQQDAMGTLVAQEKLDPVLRRINAIDDPAAKKKALTLYSKLFGIITEDEEKR